MFFTVKSYQRVAVHLQHFLNDYLKSSKVLKTEKVHCFLLLVNGLSANKQTNKTFDCGSEGRSVLLWKSKMVKKTSPNIITTPHASYHIVLTKIAGQGFGYETDYVDDKKTFISIFRVPRPFNCIPCLRLGNPKPCPFQRHIPCLGEKGSRALGKSCCSVQRLNLAIRWSFF